MNISQKMIAAAGFALITLAPAHAMDWNALGADLRAANIILAVQRQDARPRPAARAWTVQQMQDVSTRDESVAAVAGIPQLLGVRWAVDPQCNGRTIDILVTQQPRFGQIVVHEVPYTVPTPAAADGASPCAGQRITGYAIFYRASHHQAPASDHVSVKAVSEDGTASVNYRIQVAKPFG